MRSLFRIVTLLLLAALCAAPALGQSPDAYNVLYGADDQRNRRLDVYLPPDAEAPYPVVLMFPGSDARKADMKDFGLVEIVHRAGAAAVAVAYDTRAPVAAYTDAYCALAWVQANAAGYGFDPAQIVTLGHSYGALPAAMLAVQEDPSVFPLDCPHPAPDMVAVRGVATIGGLLPSSAGSLAEFVQEQMLPVDPALVETLRATPPEAWLTLDLSGPAREFLIQWPMAWIDYYEPPHLLIHGAVDLTLSYQVSMDYAQNLIRSHTNVTLVIDRYSGHVPPPFAYDRELIAFLGRAFAH